MGRLSCIALFIALNVFGYVFAEEVLYPNTYDNLDIKAILENDVLREQYYNCFMEIGPCEIKERVAALGAIYSEAYQTNCKKCTEKQKEILDTAVNWWVENDPERWKLLTAKMQENMKKKNGGQ